MLHIFRNLIGQLGQARYRHDALKARGMSDAEADAELCWQPVAEFPPPSVTGESLKSPTAAELRRSI